MSEGMLGRLTLSAVRGPRATLEDRLAGSDGEMWLDALKKFLRKQDPWAIVEPAKKQERKPRPIERWRKLSDTMLEVNLDAPFRPPVDGAVPEWQPPAGRGWVKVERIGKEVFVGGRKVILHFEPEQLEGIFSGHELRKRLQAKDTFDPRILDALVEFEDSRLIPDSWKQDSKRRILFLCAWGVGFRDRDGSLWFYYMYWDDGLWWCGCCSLDYGWGVQCPALILAS